MRHLTFAVWARLSLAVSVVLTLTPCGVGQDKKPTKKFKFTDPKDIPIPTDKDGARTIDLTLEEALRLADKNNADLSVLRFAPRRSAQDLIVAKAFYDSEIYANGGYNRQENPTVTIFATNREIYDAQAGWRRRMQSGALFDASVSAIQTTQPERRFGGTVLSAGNLYDTNISMSVTQPLLRGAWWEYGGADIRRAEGVQASADSTYEQSRQDTLLDAARAYWELVFARADYKVQYQANELAREQLRITNARIDVKDLAPRDRVADEAEVARRKEALILAENAIGQREDELRTLLFEAGDNPAWDWVLRPSSLDEPDLSNVALLDWRGIARLALEQRPLLQRLRADVLSAEQLLVLADGDTWPQLDLTGSYAARGQRSGFGSSASDTWNLEFPNWSVRLAFVYPIGNRSAQARRDRAYLNVEEARRRVFAQEITVRREVRDAVRNMKTLAESIRATKESVRLAENDLDTAQHKQRVGTLTPFDVQQRNQELQNARSRLYRNFVNFRVSEAALRHVQGGLRAAGTSDGKESKDPPK